MSATQRAELLGRVERGMAADAEEFLWAALDQLEKLCSEHKESAAWGHALLE